MSSTAFSKLSAIALDALGDINPQILREWQGRLRWQSLVGTIVLSATVQFLVLITALSGYSQNWADTGRNLYDTLSFLMSWSLTVFGVYLLSADLSKENKRGTLNFVRMSPTSANRIFLGKLLGVPVMLYVGLLAMVPMHLVAGLIGGASPVSILLSYGHLCVVAGWFFTAAMWFALFAKGLNGLQPWIAAGVSIVYLAPLWPYLFIQRHRISEDIHEFLAFLTLGFAVLIGSLFWSMLTRNFKTPEKSPLGKRQSYVFTLFFSIFLTATVGGLLLVGVETAEKTFLFFSVCIPAVLGFATLLLFLLLPSKQAMLSWVRDYPDSSHTQLAKALISQDNSPPPLALAVNLAIMAGVLTLAGIWLSFDSLGTWLWQLYVCMASLLIYAMLLQHIIFSSLKNRPFVTVSAIATMIGGWPLALVLLHIPTHQNWLSWLWRTTLFYQPMESGILAGEVIVAIAAHFILLYSLSKSLPNKMLNLSVDELRRLP